MIQTPDIIFDIFFFTSGTTSIVNLCKWGEQNKVNCDILHPKINYQ